MSSRFSRCGSSALLSALCNIPSTSVPLCLIACTNWNSFFSFWFMNFSLSYISRMDSLSCSFSLCSFMELLCLCLDGVCLDGVCLDGVCLEGRGLFIYSRSLHIWLRDFFSSSRVSIFLLIKFNCS